MTSERDVFMVLKMYLYYSVRKKCQGLIWGPGTANFIVLITQPVSAFLLLTNLA